jgi:uncharacterized membrane protein YagU involved in acid resistance
MNWFQALWMKAEKKQPEGGDDATVKTADAVSCSVMGRHLEPAQKKPAGAVVHYAYGTLIGAVYGALAGAAPLVAAGRGAAYGAAAWLGGDEVAVPALGLSKSPLQRPVSEHVREFASHLVYGAVTDGVFRLFARAR